jgi:hypothetical protein
LQAQESEYELDHFSQPLQETEHICGGPQQQVAKIVQCGEKIEEEAIRKGGLNFSDVICYRTFVSDVIFGSEGLVSANVRQQVHLTK